MKIRWPVTVFMLLIILLIAVVIQQYLIRVGLFSSKTTTSLLPALDNVSEELNVGLQSTNGLKSLLK